MYRILVLILIQSDLGIRSEMFPFRTDWFMLYESKFLLINRGKQITKN